MTARACFAPRDAVQRGVIKQILPDREVEIERAWLEHHAEQPERFARRNADVMAENADAPALNPEKPRDQREQCALAGAVKAKQRREARRRNGEVDVDEGAPRAVGVADAVDRQRGYFGSIMPGIEIPRNVAGDGSVGGGHCCAIVMPQGSSPTWIVLITFWAATSITETSLDTP